VGDFDNSELDPQVTLRYRPTDDISVYGRWAQSSKAGGFDTGQTSLSPDGYEFAPEYAETFEVGAKGSYMDGRGRFDATLFTLEFTDLQISVATSNPDNPFVNLNAGSQRVRGLEFGNQFAVSDQLVLGLGGAILDGEFTNFPNSTCTEIESRDAATGPCLTAAEARALNGLDRLGNPIGFDTIDRTGTKTPRTPDWKFIADVDYWMPVMDQYKVTFSAKGFYSDGYTTDFEGFTQTVRFDKHGDVNLTLGFGDQDDIWSLSVFGRNLLEASPTYHPEFDLEADGIIQTPVSPNNYASYGIKFSYTYQ
jgi:outer membrane receptor protein involved in Fe transport